MVWSKLLCLATSTFAESRYSRRKSRARELSIQSLKQIMKVAEVVGVDYCFEVVNRYEQFIFNTAKEAIGFAEDIGVLVRKFTWILFI